MGAQDAGKGRRKFLIAATSVVGGVFGVAVAVPFLASMAPSARARAAGAPVDIDISKLEPGAMVTVEWRGKPVWVVRRDKEMLASLPKLDAQVADPKSDSSVQPPDCKNEHRSIKPEYLVLVGICTHLGCSPASKFAVGAASDMGPDWLGGFYCPCHGSLFDMAGRVFKDKPAPTNLEVPPHTYLSDTKLLIGESKGA